MNSIKTECSLVILGNGFDLNCGLESRFSDFFKNYLDEMIKCADTSYYNGTSRNLWYLLFYLVFYDNKRYESEGKMVFERIYKNNPLWMDIESFIKLVVASDKTNNEWINRHFGIRYSSYIKVLESLFKSRFDGYTLGESNQFSSIRKFFRNRFPNGAFIVMVDFLFDELIQFESDFKKYINNLLNSNQDYFSKYSRLFSELIDIKEYFSVISFNYTPFLGGPSNKEFLKNFYNIHGSLKDNIIIGYDASDLEERHYGSIKMCKAWQKMNNGSTQFLLPDKEIVSTIKVYGHSLGKQDYSYFHAIFDNYNIFNGSVKLVFYYTEYGYSEEENNVIRSNYISSVFKLLNSYVVNSGLEDKTKTIISRLQLENRLFIYPIVKIS